MVHATVSFYTTFLSVVHLVGIPKARLFGGYNFHYFNKGLIS